MPRRGGLPMNNHTLRRGRRQTTCFTCKPGFENIACRVIHMSGGRGSTSQSYNGCSVLDFINRRSRITIQIWEALKPNCFSWLILLVSSSTLWWIGDLLFSLSIWINPSFSLVSVSLGTGSVGHLESPTNFEEECSALGFCFSTHICFWFCFKGQEPLLWLKVRQALHGAGLQAYSTLWIKDTSLYSIVTSVGRTESIFTSTQTLAKARRVPFAVALMPYPYIMVYQLD